MVKRNRAREARRMANGHASVHVEHAPARVGGARAGTMEDVDPGETPDAVARPSPTSDPTDPTDPSTEPRRIGSPKQAQELAGWLLDPRRHHPVVVVSIPAGRKVPWIDAGAILTAVRGYAEVVVLPTDASSWALSDALPEGTQVYGGAGRVYPVGTGWTTSLQRSPLRFAYAPSDSERATEHLISDALTMAGSSGPSTAGGRRAARRGSGVVGQVVEPSRAMVTLDDGGVATIWQELTLPDVTIGQIVASGQRVSGTLDHENRLDVSAGLRRGARTVAHYRPDDVVLARVTSVRPDVVRVELHPGVTIAVARDRVTTNPSDSLTALFSVGEVVVARVAEFDGVHPALRFDDVDDEDVPRAASALLEGGPPWLTAPESVAWETQEEADGASPGGATQVAGRASSADGGSGGALVPRGAGGPSVPRGAVHTLSLTLDAARARIAELEAELEGAHASGRDLDDLRRRVAWLDEENRRLRKQVQDQRSQLRKEKQRGQKADRERGSGRGVDPVPSGPLFLDEVEQLRHEVYTEWATRISPAEKAERPLAPYEVGPDFLASLTTLEGVSREKVVQVVVEVLTGLAEELDGRQLHDLRQGRAGNSPTVTRPGGWICFRAALQRETPGARRLSYWRRGNKFELSRVVHHDDLDP